jgi:AraC family transcriptional regulator
MAHAITKKEVAPQPVLVATRRVKPAEIATTLAQALGCVFAHAQEQGFMLAGPPFTRYLEKGPELWTIEAGLPVAAHVAASPSGDVRGENLPGGLAATTTHAGSYDQLDQAHAAIRQWIEAEGLTAAGAPWESYITDPGDYPDPKDWRTEIFWPLAGR